MKNKKFTVNILTGNKSKLQGAEKATFYSVRCNGHNAIIPQSHITENELIINSGSVKVSKEMFEDWFKESIEAEQAEKKRIQEEYDSFYPHIPLFWANREMILKEPRFYSIKPPQYFFGTDFSGPTYATLGQLLKIWESEDALTSLCSCGGKSVVYQFGAHLLSGRQVDCLTICVACGKFMNEGNDGNNKFSGSSFREKTTAYMQHKIINPISETPASYEELIATCESKKQIIN